MKSGYVPRPEIEGRNGEIYRRYMVYGDSQQAIANRFGISQQRVSDILAAATDEVKAQTQQELIRQSQARLAEITARYVELADKVPAPVTAGKDGIVLVDPETKEVVRDYALQLAALAGLRATDAELAKRMGLNAPDKAVVQTSVRYEIAGLSPEDLT